MSTTSNGDGTIVLESTEPGRVVVPQPSRLKRLNYFDGKFLRADDLRLEQDYLRRLVHVSNQAGGPGVVMGLDTTLDGDALRVGPGQAIDGEGRVLLLSEAAELSLSGLIEASRGAPVGAGATAAGSGSAAFGPCEVERAEPPPVTIADGGAFYVIWLGWAEALCGEEDVVGQLCEAACSTSVDRPYRLEGVVVRALPLSLALPPAPGNVVAFHTGHLRSRVASAYYADEWARAGSLISASGLALPVWCRGSHPNLGRDVPIALVGIAGATSFIDAWIVRRERLEPPARQYWAGRMRMRPWPTYLAQILQFQCQLSDLLRGGGAPGTPSPCGEALEEAKQFIASIEADIRAEERSAERARILARLEEALGAAAAGADATGALVRGGIVETPPAGYLPVRISTTETVNDQVAAWFGQGVDLRFCVVRPDVVAHALEEAQHMERISLLEGLADPERKPRVDVLVPNGTVAPREQAVRGRGWDTAVGAGEAGTALPYGDTQLRGVTRTETLAAGGGALHFAGGVAVELPQRAQKAVAELENVEMRKLSLARLPAGLQPRRAAAQLWLTATCADDVFSRDSGSVLVRAELAAAASVGPLSVAGRGTLFGELTIRSTSLTRSGARRVRVTFNGMAQAELGGDLELDPVTVPPVDLLLTLRQDGADGRLDVQWLPPEEVEEKLEEPIALRIEWAGAPALATISTLSLRNVRGQTAQLKAFAERRKVSFDTEAVSGVEEALDQALEERVTVVVAREDARVLAPEDTRRRLAEDRIERIGCLLGDEAFTADALATLFPPLALAGAQKLLATLDWVLFHRRRERDCGEEPRPAPPAPQPPRATVCHSVFGLEPHLIERVQELIQNGRLAQARKLLRPLGEVAFDLETSEIVDAGTVAARWGGAPPPVRAWPYWVDGDPEAGSAAVREARVRAIAGLVGAREELDVFGGPVEGRLEPCPVWVLLEAAEPQVATVRHEVYYLRQDSDFNLIEQLREGRRVLEAIAAGAVPHEGHAVFERGSDAIVVAESDLPPLPFTWEYEAYEALVFRGPVDVAGEPIDGQGKAIADRIASGRFAQSFGVSVLDAATHDGWPEGASVITIVTVTG
jgi:hypothetical protein